MQIDGKKIADQKLLSLKEKFAKKAINEIAIIQIGDNKASKIYINKKIKIAKELGINVRLINFKIDVQEEEIKATIKKLNNDQLVNGYIIQLPIPQHIQLTNLIKVMDPQKDLDAFTPYHLGLSMIDYNEGNVLSPTANAVLTIIKKYKIELSGKNILIIGNTILSGKPLMAFFLTTKATVTIAHSETKNLNQKIKEADIIISAAGVPNLINKNNVKLNVIVIDVGINFLADNILVGDTNFAEVEPLAKLITPVPGGVGPLTVISLFENLYKLSEENYDIKKS